MEVKREEGENYGAKFHEDSSLSCDVLIPQRGNLSSWLATCKCVVVDRSGEPRDRFPPPKSTSHPRPLLRMSPLENFKKSHVPDD